MLTALRAAICLAALESRLKKGSERVVCGKGGAPRFCTVWFRACWGLRRAVRWRRGAGRGTLTTLSSSWLSHARKLSMARSEIDDIFAPPKKKIKTSPSQLPHQPETILDPSKKQAPQKRPRRREKTHTKADNDRFKDSRGSAPRASLLSFSSIVPISPGRKTTDGYNIYKEDELGISTTGGGDHLVHPSRSVLSPSCPDTPLCPFDCQCCPSPMFHPAFSSSFPPPHRFLNATQYKKCIQASTIVSLVSAAHFFQDQLLGVRIIETL